MSFYGKYYEKNEGVCYDLAFLLQVILCLIFLKKIHDVVDKVRGTSRMRGLELKKVSEKLAKLAKKLAKAKKSSLTKRRVKYVRAYLRVR